MLVEFTKAGGQKMLINPNQVVWVQESNSGFTQLKLADDNLIYEIQESIYKVEEMLSGNESL